VLAPGFGVAKCEIERAFLRINRASANRVVEHSDHFARRLGDIDAACPGIRALFLRRYLVLLQSFPFPFHREKDVGARSIISASAIALWIRARFLYGRPPGVSTLLCIVSVTRSIIARAAPKGTPDILGMKVVGRRHRVPSRLAGSNTL